jgi:serine/threonine-protein kinase
MQPGDIIEGRYRLDRKLGEGGMAVVFLANDLRLERPVAVKLLLSGDEREREALREQFLREARLAASVRHRNVVQILDFGTHQGRPFMVMEALEGESMADKLGRPEPFRLQDVVELALGCLDGLTAVHTAGVVHRDLKPENVFMVRDQAGMYPKLLDFGISKAVKKRGELRSAVTTEEGYVLGTPEYMSPEQARGLVDIDRRSDLYSLGVVMYEALVGHAPFESTNPGDLLVMVIAGQAKPVVERVPAVGQALSDVIAKAMARDREQRFENADAMRVAMVAASASLPNLELPRHVRRAESGADAQGTLEQALAQITPGGRTGKGSFALPLIGFGLVLAMAAGVVAYALRATHRPEPRYIVVQSGAQAGGAAPSAPSPPATPTPTPEPAAPSTPPPAAAPAPTVAQLAVPSARPSRPAAVTAAPARPVDPATQVARAFETQKAAVVRCLTEHSADVPAETELSVRIGLSPEGGVTTAAVLPDTLGVTPAGSCIASAVKVMSFPAQPGPVVVRVPFTARRK